MLLQKVFPLKEKGMQGNKYILHSTGGKFAYHNSALRLNRINEV